MCRVSNAQLKIISSVGDFDKLLKKSFDFTLFPPDLCQYRRYRKRLNRGSKLFSLLVNGEVAHVTWLGLDKATSYGFYPFSPKKDKDLVGYIGETMTAPKYRRRGINLYVHSEIFRYLRERKIPRALLSICKENVPARNSQVKLRSHIVEEKHELRIFLLFGFQWTQTYRENS